MSKEFLIQSIGDEFPSIADQSRSYGDEFRPIDDQFRPIDDQFRLPGDGSLLKNEVSRVIAGRFALKVGLWVSIACLEVPKEARDQDIEAQFLSIADL
jgi:hypothetical protein